MTTKLANIKQVNSISQAILMDHKIKKKILAKEKLEILLMKISIFLNLLIMKITKLFKNLI